MLTRGAFLVPTISGELPYFKTIFPFPAKLCTTQCHQRTLNTTDLDLKATVPRQLITSIPVGSVEGFEQATSNENERTISALNAKTTIQ